MEDLSVSDGFRIKRAENLHLSHRILISRGEFLKKLLASLDLINAIWKLKFLMILLNYGCNKSIQRKERRFHMETNTQKSTERETVVRLGALHINEEDVRVVREQLEDNKSVRVKRAA